MVNPVQKVPVAFTLCAALLGASSSIAVPLTWTLNGAVFDDGGSASGSFVYDSPTNTYSAINISTTSGSAFGGASYHDPHPAGGSSNSGNLSTVPDASAGGLTGLPTLLLGYASGLTNVGGTVMLGGGSAESTCSNASCSAASIKRMLIAGSLTASLPIKFSLGLTFADGGNASGSLTFDVLNGVYSAIDITTTNGSAFGGAHYGGSAQADSNAVQFFGLNDSPSSSLSNLRIKFSQPLDSPEIVDSVGLDDFIVGVLPSESREDQCLDSTCSIFSPLRLVTEGSASTAAVPAPSPLLLGLLGGLALFAVHRRGEKH
jgi:hypothetical protein